MKLRCRYRLECPAGRDASDTFASWPGSACMAHPQMQLSSQHAEPPSEDLTDTFSREVSRLASCHGTPAEAAGMFVAPACCAPDWLRC